MCWPGALGVLSTKGTTAQDLSRKSIPFMRKSRLRLPINPYFILLVGLSLFALGPLLSPGYFYDAHDGRHSVFYLLEFDRAFRDGAWWPRWGIDHAQGYGYPTFVLQAPLAFYTAEIFILLGAGYTLAAKLTWTTGFLLSGWGMVHLVRYWIERGRQSATRIMAPGADEESSFLAWGAAVVAGLLYVYAPYHLVDIYVRGALAEFFILAWFPWVFWAFDRLMVEGTGPGWQGRLVTATLFYAAVILTHTFALIFFTPLLIGFIFFRLALKWYADRRLSASAAKEGTESPRAGRNLLNNILLAGGAGMATLLLASIFILPLLVEGPLLDQTQYTGGTYNYQNHFVFFGQFFNPFWGFGFSDDPTGVNDGMGFQVGAMLLLLAIVAIYLLLRRRMRRPIAWFLLGATLILLLSMTPMAQIVWTSLPILSVVQFPWRLLALVVFLLSALGGLTVWHLLPALPDRQDMGGLLVVGLLVIFGSFSYARAQLQPIEPWRNDVRLLMDFEQEHPPMIARTKWVKEPFSESPLTDDYLAENYQDTGYLERLAVVKGAGEVLSQTSSGASFQGVVRAQEPVTLQLRAYYFPGWQITVDGQTVQPRVSDPYGLMEIDVPQGEHTIRVRMGSSPDRALGTAISGVMVVVLAGLWLWGRKQRA